MARSPSRAVNRRHVLQHRKGQKIAAVQRNRSLGSLFFATCQRDRLNSCRLSAASGDTMKKPDAVSTDCDLDRRTVLKFGAGISAFSVASHPPVSAPLLANNNEISPPSAPPLLHSPPPRALHSHPPAPAPLHP